MSARPRGERVPGRAREPAARGDAKRLLFFVAAEPLFQRYGYRKTTVEDICHAAGTSKRTFYEVFTDKTDLASRWILHVSLAIVARWEASVTPEMAARRKLERFIEEYVRLGREHRVFGQMINDPDLLRAFGQLTGDRRFKLLMDVVRGIVAEGVRRGEFRRVDTGAATWIIYSLLDTMYYLVPATGAIASPFENPKLARELRGFLINALMSPERRDAR